MLTGQVVKETKRDSLHMNSVELNTGDYLIKSSHNLRNAVISTAASTVLFYISSKSKDDFWRNSCMFMGVCTQLYGTYELICIPINLNKAGKSYKREH